MKGGVHPFDVAVPGHTVTFLDRHGEHRARVVKRAGETITARYLGDDRTFKVGRTSVLDVGPRHKPHRPNPRRRRGRGNPESFSDLPLRDRMALICPCGDCGLDPEEWQCHPRPTAAEKARARKLLERIGYYERAARVRGKEPPRPNPGAYYVSVIHGGKGRLVVGPFATHARASAEKPKVMRWAESRDPRAAFVPWGIARYTEVGTAPQGAWNGEYGHRSNPTRRHHLRRPRGTVASRTRGLRSCCYTKPSGGHRYGCSVLRRRRNPWTKERDSVGGYRQRFDREGVYAIVLPSTSRQGIWTWDLWRSDGTGSRPIRGGTTTSAQRARELAEIAVRGMSSRR